jgi:hypothetical protein
MPITDSNERQVTSAARCFRGFKYRELRKWIAQLPDVAEDKVVRDNLIRTACYLKVHAELYNCHKYCKYMFKNYLLASQQDKYQKDIIFLSDLVYSREDEEVILKERSKVDWYSTIDSDRTDKQDILVCLSGFPRWELQIGKDKESKMGLAMLPPPKAQNIARVRDLIDSFLDKIELPDHITIPNEEEIVNASTQKYLARGDIMEDRDYHAMGHGDFLYQSFMTGPLTLREVWLPSPEYKRSSKFWHLVITQIIKDLPYNAFAKSEFQIWQQVGERLCKHKTLDLKGFGLQFPKEYCYEALDAISKRYPYLKEEADRACAYIGNINVIEGNNYHKTTRGTGLGYFENLKCLVMFAIYQNYYLVSSFADDSLISSDHYDAAVGAISELELVLNKEKSGIEREDHAHFVGADLNIDEINLLDRDSSEVSAIFNCRFHWERKALCSNLEAWQQATVAYHCYRIYGREFNKYEVFTHVSEGGYLSIVPRKGGESREKYACMYNPPNDQGTWKPPEVLADLIAIKAIDRSKINRIRKERYRKNIHIDMDAYYALKPPIDLGPEKIYDDGREPYPDWAERALISLDLTGGASVGLLSRDEVMYAMREYSYAQDPLAVLSRGMRRLEVTPIPTHRCAEDYEAAYKKLNATHVGHRLAFLERERVLPVIEGTSAPDLPRETEGWGEIPTLDSYRFSALPVIEEEEAFPEELALTNVESVIPLIDDSAHVEYNVESDTEAPEFSEAYDEYSVCDLDIDVDPEEMSLSELL